MHCSSFLPHSQVHLTRLVLASHHLVAMPYHISIAVCVFSYVSSLCEAAKSTIEDVVPPPFVLSIKPFECLIKRMLLHSLLEASDIVTSLRFHFY